jgi:hypothetical protein
MLRTTDASVARPGTPGWIFLALLACAFMALTSLAGLFSDAAYSRETATWAAQGVGQDLINVAVVVPALIISAFFARRGSVRARMVLVGALLYMTYSFVLYALFVHFGPLFLPYVAALGLSVFALIGSLSGLDAAELQRAIAAHPWRRATAGFLVVIGGLFAVLWLSEIVPATLASQDPASVIESQFPVNPIHVLDLALFLPATIATGVLLWRGRPAGLLFAIPILAFLSLMGTAIIAMVLVMQQRGIPAPIPMLVVTAMIVVGADLLTVSLLTPRRA